MRPSPRLLLCLATTVAAGPLRGQPAPEDRGSIIIVLGAEPALPIPLLSYASANLAVQATLFLPLARIGRGLETTRESTFEPALARSWTRRDSVTLAFDLDRRARWHDGTPVTSRDVVWTIGRARDSAASPTTALLMRRIASVEAEGPHTVVFRFHSAYAEQMYDAVYHAWPLPAHLLAAMPFADIPASPYGSAPVGNGPYRWGRAEPGRRLELLANSDFFLGRPKLQRVVFVLVRNAEAQLNLLLDGTADALESFVLARQIQPVMASAHLTIETIPSLSVSYLLFNHADPDERTRPHPILSDSAIRRAIVHAIDRSSLLRNLFGPYANRTDGPFAQASWIRRIAPPGPAYDLPLARRLLRGRGWRDRDGDGIVERGGQPLELTLIYPGTSTTRVALAEPIQAMLRRAGIHLELVRLDGPIWYERRSRGDFDIDFSQAGLDPTPSGLVQSWSCAGIGGSNVARVCYPEFDAALHRAIDASDDARAAWGTAVAALQRKTPAAFLYSPADVVVLHRRYRNVSFRSESPWADLWRWSVDPTQRLRRDIVPRR